MDAASVAISVSDDPFRHRSSARAYDRNPLEPKWRKILNLEDRLWICDYFIGETALFPGAGTLKMAVEAVGQHVLADSSSRKPIKGYLVHEAEFTSPIVVRPGAEGNTEVLVSLRPVQPSYEKIVSRHEVR